MKRRTFISMLAATFVALVMAFCASSQATAQMQNPNCCTFTIDARNTIPANCFPLHVETEWGPGIRIVHPIPAPGIYVFPLPAPCPPAFLFNWVRVLPNCPMVVLWNTGACFLPWCNYLLTYDAKLDANGCVYITLW